MSKILVILPAYNEQENIEIALKSLLEQTRKPDKIVVAANGCTDSTIARAKKFPVTVMEMEKLKHGKSEALNRAWIKHKKNYDIVVCADADTLFSNNSIEVWEKILGKKQPKNQQEVVGCTGVIRIIGEGITNTFQYFSFRHFVDLSVKHQQAMVLYGAACAIKNKALEEVAKSNNSNVPWDYHSDVEDYKLGFDLRKIGYNIVQTPDAYIETPAMPTVKMIFAQNVRWISGAWKTHFKLGFSRVNSASLISWWIPDLIRAVLKFSWLIFTIILLIIDWRLYPISIVILLILHLGWLRPYIFTESRNWRDQFIKFSFFPLEYYSWISSAINVTAFYVAVKESITKQTKNRWRDKG